MSAWSPDAEVYFIGVVGGGPVKIGFASHPDRYEADSVTLRMQSLMSWSPYPLEIIARMRGGPVIEAWFHHRFRAHRMHGEWFRPAPAILDAAATIRETAIFPGAPAEPPLVDQRYTNQRWPIASLKPQDLCERIGVTINELAGRLDRGVSALRQQRLGIPTGLIWPAIDLAAEHGITLTLADFFPPTPEPERSAA